MPRSGQFIPLRGVIDVNFSPVNDMTTSHPQTLIAALTRLSSMIEPTLYVAILGAEVMELDKVGNDAGTFLAEYHEFLAYLEKIGVTKLHMAYIGPNLPHEYGDGSLIGVKRVNMDIKIEIERALFHESSYATRSESTSRLDLVIAYNGGIWGYDSWAPTFDLLFWGKFQGVKVVVTSYTLQESEDDYDAMKEFFDKGVEKNANLELLWLWDCEKNPYGSTVEIERRTKNIDTGERLESYYENNYWQCLSSKKKDAQRKAAKITCRRCHTSFDPSSNTDSACIYHPESWCGETAQRWMAPGETKGGGDIHSFYSCCGASDPAAGGCCATRHEGYDEPESGGGWGRRPDMGI